MSLIKLEVKERRRRERETKYLFVVPLPTLIVVPTLTGKKKEDEEERERDDEDILNATALKTFIILNSDPVTSPKLNPVVVHPLPYSDQVGGHSQRKIEEEEREGEPKYLRRHQIKVCFLNPMHYDLRQRYFWVTSVNQRGEPGGGTGPGRAGRVWDLGRM